MANLNSVRGGELAHPTTEPVGALIEFYQAFNEQSLSLLELNWLDSDETSINSPFGGMARGWTKISGVYHRMFRLTAKPSLELLDYTIRETGDAFLCFGEEAIRFQRNGAVVEVRSQSSRWFTRAYGRWRQLHYHGSVDEPAHLQELQTWIQGDSRPAMATVDRVTLS